MIESEDYQLRDLAKNMIEGYYINDTYSEELKEINEIFIEKDLRLGSKIHLSPYFNEFRELICELNRKYRDRIILRRICDIK